MGRSMVAVAVWLIAFGAMAGAQQGKVSDAEYTAQALSAAPKSVAKEAAVVRMEQDGSMRTLPPLNHEQFVAATRKWVEAGMPCPQQ